MLVNDLYLCLVEEMKKLKRKPSQCRHAKGRHILKMCHSLCRISLKWYMLNIEPE